MTKPEIRFFEWRDMLNYTGRASAKHFALMNARLVAIAIMVGLLFLALLGLTGHSPVLAWVFTALAVAMSAVGFMLALSMSAMRLHDMGLSTWWLLGIVGIGFVPALANTAALNVLVAIVASGVQLVLFFRAGQPIENRYGPAQIDDETMAPRTQRIARIAQVVWAVLLVLSVMGEIFDITPRAPQDHSNADHTNSEAPYQVNEDESLKLPW